MKHNPPSNVQRSLGTLHMKILWFHDVKDYDSLEEAAKELLQQLQFKEDVGKKVSILIKECYYLADVAEKHATQKNFKMENETYYEVLRKFLEIEQSLGYQSSIGKFQIKWWMNFRKRRRLLVVYYILRQHIRSFGVRHLSRGLKATYYLIRVGLGHNRRDKNYTVKYATKYWTLIISKFPKERYPFLG